MEKQQGIAVLNRFAQIATFYKQDAIAKKAKAAFDKYVSKMPQNASMMR
jgi:hypothetical protein